MTRAIPRVLHQVWLGPSPLPDAFAAYSESWLEHHPGWQRRLWTEENLPADLRRTEVYELLRSPVERSDILRLEVLWREGGVYVDTDFECLRAIDDLLEGVELFVATTDGGFVNNAIIGATPGHPLLDRALESLTPRTFHGYDKESAGPRFLDRFLAGRPGVTIFPSTVFYPASEAERASAHAVHHSARGWYDETALRAALAKALARNERLHRRIARLEARTGGLGSRRRPLAIARRFARAVARRIS